MEPAKVLDAALAYSVACGGVILALVLTVVAAIFAISGFKVIRKQLRELD